MPQNLAASEFFSWMTQARKPRRDRRSFATSGCILPAAVHEPWMDIAWDWLQASNGHHCLVFNDPDYPVLLREIPDPPLVLFARGDLSALNRPQVALVGARKATPGARETAGMLAQELAGSGVSVVSGLAHGVDAAAHHGALVGGGVTVAVLGCGPDKVYPINHLHLAERIVDRGLLISEFAPGTGPRRAHFPQRNRIISGLAPVTVIVEAGERSGSLLTARLAMEQGRDVGAVPGSIHNFMAAGSNRLLRDGASVITSTEDILTLIPDFLSYRAAPQVCNSPRATPDPVLAALETFPVSMDRLLARTGLLPAQLAARLSELELAGFAGRDVGGYYRTCSENKGALTSRARQTSEEQIT